MTRCSKEQHRRDTAALTPYIPSAAHHEPRTLCNPFCNTITSERTTSDNSRNNWILTQSLRLSRFGISLVSWVNEVCLSRSNS